MLTHERADTGLARRRSRYWPQVVRLIPAVGVLDRETELAELAEFARPGPTPRPYLDWVGEPGSGKTALAACFAAHPPDGVDVVAFFVSRARGHQSAEFWDYACDQLAALLDRSPPAMPDDTTFGELWEAAGLAAAASGRTLLLLIDGLDENEPRVIGSAIPADGDANRRVVVFRRPSAPALVGGDPDAREHKTLGKSKHADAAQQESLGALRRLLAGPSARLLAILASAEGPLSAREIAEVAGEPSPLDTDQIASRLREAMDLGLIWPTVEDPDRYAFQHRELLEVTLAALPRAIGLHRDRIKAWAGSYEARGWPPDTPPYLLSWYPRMLERSGDGDRLAALMTPARLDRLRAVTGDDTAAVGELTRALALLATARTPDVALACRTALRREEIKLALSWYPVPLLEAKAMMGQWHSAQRLASYLDRPDARAEALFAIATAAAKAGKCQLAGGFVAETFSQIGHIAEPYSRMRAVRTVAGRAAALLALIDPEMVAERLASPSDAVTALVALAQSALTARSPHQAARFIRAAYRVLAGLRGHEGAKIAKVAEVAGLATAAGLTAAMAASLGRADIVLSVACLLGPACDGPPPDALEHAVSAGRFGAAMAIAGDMTDHDQRTWATIRVAAAAVTAGHPADELLIAARALAAGLADRDQRAAALGSVAEAASLAGSFALARATTEDMTDRAQRASVLARIAMAAAKAGEPAGELLGAARRAAEGITGGTQHAWALGSLIQAALAAGETSLARHLLDEAEAFAIVPESIVRPAVLGALARAFDAQPARAARLFDQACRAAAPLESLPRALALRLLSRFAARRPSWAGHLTGEAYRADGIDDPAIRDQVLMYLAQAASEPGDPRLAASIAAGIRDPAARIDTLLSIASSTAAGPTASVTDLLLGQADVIARQCGLGWAPAAIAEAATAAGRLGPARAAAQGIAWPDLRAKARTAISRVERISGAEPPCFEATRFEGTMTNVNELAVVAEAALRAGWLATAERLAGDIPDPNQRGFLLLRVAAARRDACDPARALAIARSVLAFNGRLDHALSGQALAFTVRLTAGQDTGELVSGLVYGFDPDLFGVAQELAQAGRSPAC